MVSQRLHRAEVKGFVKAHQVWGVAGEIGTLWLWGPRQVPFSSFLYSSSGLLNHSQVFRQCMQITFQCLSEGLLSGLNDDCFLLVWYCFLVNVVLKFIYLPFLGLFWTKLFRYFCSSAIASKHSLVSVWDYVSFVGLPAKFYLVSFILE